MAAIVAHHAFRLSGRARRVEDVERIGGGDRHAVRGLAGRDGGIAQARPIVIAPGDEVRLRLRALQDQAGLGLCAREFDRLVEQRLVSHHPAGLDAAARRQDDLRLGVVEAGRQFARGEAAEHHRVDRPDAGAGQHGERRLRHHRHVEDDAIALADAEVAQDGGERLHLGEQLRIADGALCAGDRGIVDDGALRAAPARHMAVDRIEAGVAGGAHEPAAVDAGRRIENLGRLFVPVDVVRRLRPETDRVAHGAGIDLVIAARAGARLRCRSCAHVNLPRGRPARRRHLFPGGRIVAQSALAPK